MTSALTRRSLVAVAPAAIVAAAIPAIAAAENPDAALLALREPYERTLAGMDMVGPKHSRAEEAYFALKTSRPNLNERNLRKLSGLIPAERAWLRATDANLAIIRRIAKQPAHTLAGAIFKAEISSRESNSDPDLLDSLVADLVAMGGAHA